MKTKLRHHQKITNLKPEPPGAAQTDISRDDDDDLQNTFHSAIRPFLLIAQILGVFPVSGIFEKDVTRVHFSWLHIGMTMTFLVIALGALDLSLSLNIVFQRGLKMYTAGPVTFSLTALLSFITFLRVAQKWPDLIRQFNQTEKIFQEKSYETQDSQVYTSRLRRNGTILLLGAVVEQCIHIASSIYNNNYQINKCNFTVNFWENLYTRERLHLFSVIKFNVWMMPITEIYWLIFNFVLSCLRSNPKWLTISMLFAWHFIDIFLMLVTSSLAVRFGQVNKMIHHFKFSAMTDEFWLRARMDFISLMDLLKSVDEKLSELVLLSCANNLFYICFEVFQSFQSQGNTISSIHFYYSLSFVLTRILITMLSEASINDASNNILGAIYEIPIDFWGVELQRFYEIVASDFISISGKGFFFITRRMVFAMAGTVLTYELVLFDQVKEVSDGVNFCIVRKV